MIADPLPLAVTVTPVMVARYAAATDDFTPIHLDAAHARRQGLEGTIAHGLLSLGLAGRMLTEWCGDDPARLRRLRLRFLAPVPVGSEVTVRATVRGAGGVAAPPGGDEIALDLAVSVGGSVVAAGEASVTQAATLRL